MSYTIDEHNPERQHLLGEVLAPSTREVLARLPHAPNRRVLDLGCGQGNTTRLLADVLQPGECVGLEYDANLVNYARTRTNNPSVVRFEQGDATTLPFADASFDVVFCRYLLIHMAEPAHVIREMLRVVRPGGFVVAYEADFLSEFSDPPCDALLTINRLWNGLFQSPRLGRQMVRLFRESGAANIQTGAIVQVEHDKAILKRVYRLTAEAIGPRGVSEGLVSEPEVQQMIAGLTRLEEDPASVFAKFPDVWIIAQR